MPYAPTVGRASAACLVALTFALASPGCKKKPPAMTPPPAAVSVLNPIERDVVEWDEYTGRLAAVDSVEVRARVSGMLEKADFVEGSAVEKGQLLFALDRRPFEAAVKQAQGDLERAQAQLDLASVEFKRLEELKSTGSVSGTEYEQQRERVAQGRASITSAQGALQAAQLNLEWCEIRAPIAGRISYKLMTPGNWVNGGTGDSTLLTKITSEDPMYCYIDADELSLLKYQRLAREKKRVSARDAKIPAYLSLADERTFDRVGMVDFVDNQLNANTGTLKARAVFDNKDKFLKPEMFGRVRIPGSGAYKAVLIPSEVISSDQAQKIVFVVDAEGKAQVRPVKLGADFDGFRVVTSGLTVQDRVIYSGLMKVRPGAKVDAKPATWPDRPMHIAPYVDPNAPASQPATGPATGPAAGPPSPAAGPTAATPPATPTPATGANEAAASQDGSKTTNPATATEGGAR